MKRKPIGWIVLAVAAWLMVACDPRAPKPTVPPKPIAPLLKVQPLDNTLR